MPDDLQLVEMGDADDGYGRQTDPRGDFTKERTLTGGHGNHSREQNPAGPKARGSISP